MHLIFLLIFTGCISNSLHTMQHSVLEQAKESLLETSKEVTIIQKTHQSTAWRLKMPILAITVGLGSTACGIASTYFLDDYPDIKKKVGFASLYSGLFSTFYGVYTLIKDYRAIYQKTEPVMRQVIEEEVSEEAVEKTLKAQEQV